MTSMHNIDLPPTIAAEIDALMADLRRVPARAATLEREIQVLREYGFKLRVAQACEALAADEKDKA